MHVIGFMTRSMCVCVCAFCNMLVVSMIQEDGRENLNDYGYVLINVCFVAQKVC